jgi:hypothetical protein
MDSDTTKFLSLRKKFILARGLNAKHPFRKSRFSNSSGEKRLKLLDLDDFEISAPPLPCREWRCAGYCGS